MFNGPFVGSDVIVRFINIFCHVCRLKRDDQVRADGEPAGSDPTVQVLPAGGAQQEVSAGDRRGALLPEPPERAGGGPLSLI